MRRLRSVDSPAWKSEVKAATSSSVDAMAWRSSSTSSDGMKCLAHSTMPTPMPPRDEGEQDALGLGLAALPVHGGQAAAADTNATTKQTAARARPGRRAW